jgi:uncharacterized membrane protein
MNDQDPDDLPASPFSLVRAVKSLAAFGWLARGWQDIRARPVGSLFFGLCFFLGGHLMLWTLRDSPQYLSAVTVGFLILGPFLALGLYEISRRLEEEESCSPWHTLTIWRSNAGQLGVFALILLILYLLWARASMVVFALSYSGALPTYGDLLRQLMVADNLGFLLFFFGVWALFATLAFAFGLISVPLMLDRNKDAITAALTSATALVRNPLPMLVWAATIALLTLVALLPYLLGIILVAPLLGHATWHAYRDLVAPEDSSGPS